MFYSVMSLSDQLQRAAGTVKRRDGLFSRQLWQGLSDVVQ
jgi:hypothetical protein